MENRRVDQNERDLTTASRLRQQARRLEEKAKAMLREATVLQEAAERLDAAAEDGRGRRDISPALHDGDRTRTVTGVTDLQTAHGLATSRGRTGSDALVKAANAVDLTVKGLVAELEKRLGRKVLRTSLIMARQGRRPIKRDIAEAIQVMTRSPAFPRGFEANRKNWPRLED